MEKELVKSLSPTLLEVTPSDVIKSLSEQFGLKTQSIRKILSGDWNRPDVITIAIKLLQQKKQALDLVLWQITSASAT